MTTRPRSLLRLDEIPLTAVAQFMTTASDIECGRLDCSTMLSGEILVPLFFQESSRTYLNSSAAFMRMGGRILPVVIDNTRLNSRWSEPIRDFCELLNSCCDYVIVRSPDVDKVLEFAKWCEKPIINAGNGFGAGSEHPVQTLVDLYVIQQFYGTSPLNILMIGGKHIRTTRTQTKLFHRLGHRVDIIPSKVTVDNYDMDDFYSNNTNEYNDVRTIDLTQYHVIYHNGADEDHNARPSDNVKLTRDLLASRLFNGIVLHSLPRLQELATDLDDTPFNAYYTQMRKAKLVFKNVFTYLKANN
jgi:aspartate carbamoyltransferase catalytic subunit